jgi:hypothetical protein
VLLLIKERVGMMLLRLLLVAEVAVLNTAKITVIGVQKMQQR